MKSIFNTPEAADYIFMSVSFMKGSRGRGDGPTFLKLGRSIRYKIEDLDAWLETRKRQNTIDLRQKKVKTA